MKQTVLSTNLRTGALLVFGLLVSLGALAQAREPSPLQVSIWASSCMACHGPEGRAEGTGLTIGGRPADDLLGKLMAYKSGKLTATIMHQHAKGYSDNELRLIANYFSTLK
ncbi:MAG: class I cytochrome c [Burkholderiaceae bacterium]|nr:class I cytochrome c [Burkholderiaceae bacterium]MDP3423210.1 class I cytochrome c [Burkholderiaceae bacterium]MDZ4162568.1 class I cytochrome c [Burkholderiales bacterium]